MRYDKIDNGYMILLGFVLTSVYHKVDITSDVIANVCSSYSAKGKDPIVVDAGDGKGYLSSHLALKYKLKVLGVDAKSDHTNGAINRMEKLEVIGRILHIANFLIIYANSFLAESMGLLGPTAQK